MIQTIRCPVCSRIQAIDADHNPFRRNGTQYCSYACMMGDKSSWKDADGDQFTLKSPTLMQSLRRNILKRHRRGR